VIVCKHFKSSRFTQTDQRLLKNKKNVLKTSKTHFNLIKAFINLYYNCSHCWPISRH